MSDVISRRCSCRNPETGRSWGKACPQLSSSKHGSWAIRVELPPRADGSRRQFRRSGFDSKKKAKAELDAVKLILTITDEDDDEGSRVLGDLLESCAASRESVPGYEETARRFKAGQQLDQQFTLGTWLDLWIAGKKRLRESTRKRYEVDIRHHLKPHLGHIRIDRLQVHHLDEMFAAIEERNAEILESNALRRKALADLRNLRGRGPRREARKAIAELPPFRRITGTATQHHIRRTLRNALNAAIARQLITFNPAKHIELEPAKRPKPVLWTDARVEHWRATGEKPTAVMVWTPELTGQFLDHIQGNRLYALFHLMAFRGLRRGEACGLRRVDLDLKAETLTVATQLVQDGWQVVESAPKTDSGTRTISLDQESVGLLRHHLAQQAADKLSWGTAWTETGRVFTRENGEWLHPGLLTDLFERLVEEADLPPIRLHDLRHGAATLALAAGANMKHVQDMLGHASITITADTYTSVLPEIARTIADAAVRLVPRRARDTNPETPSPRHTDATVTRLCTDGSS